MYRYRIRFFWSSSGYQYRILFHLEYRVSYRIISHSSDQCSAAIIIGLNKYSPCNHKRKGKIHTQEVIKLLLNWAELFSLLYTAAQWANVKLFYSFLKHFERFGRRTSYQKIPILMHQSIGKPNVHKIQKRALRQLTTITLPWRIFQTLPFQNKKHAWI